VELCAGGELGVKPANLEVRHLSCNVVQCVATLYMDIFMCMGVCVWVRVCFENIFIYVYVRVCVFV